VRLIEVTGEAAKAVPDEARARHPEVEWRRIGRARGIMAHLFI
jgi:uncharacterized protein with HEPN domain